MPKTLRITFSGICTLAPGIPRAGDATPSIVYVMMPQARESLQNTSGATWVARHHAFLYIPDVLLGAVPEPAMLVRDKLLGLCNVYLLDHARIRFTPKAQNSVKYFTTALPLGERPGGPGGAPMEDCRWLPDVRDILPPGTALRPEIDPRKSSVGEDVTLVVELNGGIIKANLPCETVQPRKFVPPGAFPGERVMASEFIVEMEYPDNATTAKLAISQLDPQVEIEGIAEQELVLRFGTSTTIDIRIGNDTLDEIVALRNGARCDVTDLPFSFDNDFDLHYDLLAAITERPLPQNGGRHSEHNGCVGYMVPLPAGG